MGVRRGRHFGQDLHFMDEGLLLSSYFYVKNNSIFMTVFLKFGYKVFGSSDSTLDLAPHFPRAALWEIGMTKM